MSLGVGELVRPKALRRGARVAVVSPASTPKEEKVRAGMATLTELGYEPVLFPSALGGGPLYYAGTLEQRVADFHAAFADRSIDAVFCTRGGWGSAELLPHLDAALVRANPKAFVGYSDHTSLHVWLAKECGLLSFYGPMVAADFAREDGWEPVSWRAAFEGASRWTLDEAQGLRTLQPGIAEGVVFGGCISIFAEALGTAYAMPPAGPGESRILFLEDIGTKPYQWDRMLLHLQYAGMLDGVAGIVFGDMQQCVPPEEEALLEAAIRHRLQDFAGPIAIGLRSGHVDTPNVTVPLGVRARLDLSSAPGPRLEFLEQATV